MSICAWLMPFIGVAAIISFLFSGRPYELGVGIIALVWGTFIYRNRFGSGGSKGAGASSTIRPGIPSVRSVPGEPLSGYPVSSRSRCSEPRETSAHLDSEGHGRTENNEDTRLKRASLGFWRSHATESRASAAECAAHGLDLSDRLGCGSCGVSAGQRYNGSTKGVWERSKHDPLSSIGTTVAPMGSNSAPFRLTQIGWIF